MNQYHRLGNVSRESLHAIWTGGRAAELRARLAADDLSLGCELCQVHVDAGDGASAYLHVFDALAPTSSEPDWPQQLELALSNACNLQCVMCNGDLSSAIRVHREGRAALPEVYGEAFFDELDDFLPHLQSVVFLGGEPFLGKETLRVMDRLIQLGLTPRCHVTTNGTQWNKRVERIVAELPVHVAISIDAASAATTSAIRVGADHDLVLANTKAIRDVARATGSGCSISFSLQRANVHEFGAVLAWADGLDIDVAVNSVAYPPEFSLQLLSGDELDRVIDALHEEDRRRSVDLDRNLPRWTATVAMVTAMRDNRTATPVSIGTGPHAAARALAALGADERGVSVVHCDEHQLIGSVEPDVSDALGIDFRRYIGRSAADMVEAFTSMFGPTERTALERHDDGLEERTMVFRQPGGGQTRLRVVLAETGDGRQHWYIAARRTA
jgi:molybdenum cofactor biosynthesis enzyme MoaA